MSRHPVKQEATIDDSSIGNFTDIPLAVLRMDENCNTEVVDHTEEGHAIDNVAADDAMPAAPTRQSVFELFWETIHSWANVTTFHGVRNVFDRETSVYRRIIWICIVFTFVVILTWYCQDQLNRYLEYNTLNKETVISQTQLVFPAVTICNFNLIRNSSVDETSRDLLLNIFKSPNKTILSDTFDEQYLQDVSIRQIFEDGFSQIDNQFLDCKWEAKSFNCSEQFFGRMTEAGYCYTFNFNSDSKEINTTLPGSKYGLGLVLWTGRDEYLINDDETVGFKVLIHSRDEDPDMGLALALGPGSTHYIAVSTHQYNYLPHPVKAFGDLKCLDRTSEPYIDNYSVSSCMQTCRRDYIYARCGCVTVFEKDIYPECSPIEMIDCYQDAVVDFIGEAKSCSCPTPCDVTKYQTKHSSALFQGDSYINIQTTRSEVTENILSVRIFYESKEIHVHEQVLELAFEDAWGLFGGMVGLCVGASVLTFVEIFEMSLIQARHYFRQVRNIANRRA